MVDVASHVVSQKSLERKLLSTVGALKHLFPVGNVLSFAVIQKLHLVTNTVLKIMLVLKLCKQNSRRGRQSHPVSKETSTGGTTNQALLGVAPGC